MISVLVFTKNEEQDLPGCLESVSWSDDVHVFDSFSTDGTLKVAGSFGAKVQQRKFDNYASQKNAGLRELQFLHQWVLLLDADERIPVPLAHEMKAFSARAPRNVSAARLRRRDFFMGRWLKHAQISPFYIRLVRPQKIHYERPVNELVKVEGEIVDLNEPFDHFPFSKGICHWVDKHNTYSTMEAELVQADLNRFSFRRAFFERDFNERRFHQKGLFMKAPFRPLLKFAYMILLRRAFLDGRPGIAYAFLQSFYEYLIVLKTRELQTGNVIPRRHTLKSGQTASEHDESRTIRRISARSPG